MRHPDKRHESRNAAPPSVDGETVHDIRCEHCNRKLAEMATSPWLFTCPRCKGANARGWVPVAAGR